MDKHSNFLVMALIAMFGIFSIVLVFKGDFRDDDKSQKVAALKDTQGEARGKKTPKINWTASKMPETSYKRTPSAVTQNFSQLNQPQKIIDRRGKIQTSVEIVKDDLGRELIADDIIVTVRAGTSVAKLEEMEKNYNLSLKYFDPVIGVAHFKTPKDSKLSRGEYQEILIGSYRSVTSAEPNQVMENFGSLPTEITKGQLWYLKNDGSTDFEVFRSDGSSFVVQKERGMDIFDGQYLNGAFDTSTSGWTEKSSCGNGLMAIIDSGFDPDHPDVKGRYLTSKSQNVSCPQNNGKERGFASFFSSAQSNCYDPGEHQKFLLDLANGDELNHKKAQASMIHGHYVASVIIANHNNGGAAGICPTGNIIPIIFGTFVRSKGQVRYIFTALDGAIAIKLAVDAGAKVINVSWGALSSSSNYPSDNGESYPAHHSLVRAVKYAKAKGAMIISAAGNSAASLDDTPFAPPSLSEYFDNVISVAAYGPEGKLWKESSRTNVGSNFGPSTVDVVAPGQFIFSPNFSSGFINTVPSAYLNNSKNGELTAGSKFSANTHTYANGTSNAAPMVTALAALAYQRMLNRFEFNFSPEEYDYPLHIKRELFMNAQNKITCEAGQFVKSQGCIHGYFGIKAANLNAFTNENSFVEIDNSFLTDMIALGGNVNASLAAGSTGEDSGSSGISSSAEPSAGGGGGGCGFIDPSSGGTPPTFPILFLAIPLLIFLRKRNSIVLR